MSKFLLKYLEDVNNILSGEKLEITDTSNSLYEELSSKVYRGKEVMDAYANCPILSAKSTYWSATIRDLKNEIIYIHYKDHLLKLGYKTYQEAFDDLKKGGDI